MSVEIPIKIYGHILRFKKKILLIINQEFWIEFMTEFELVLIWVIENKKISWEITDTRQNKNSDDFCNLVSNDLLENFMKNPWSYFWDIHKKFLPNSKQKPLKCPDKQSNVPFFSLAMSFKFHCLINTNVYSRILHKNFSQTFLDIFLKSMVRFFSKITFMYFLWRMFLLVFL